MTRIAFFIWLFSKIVKSEEGRSILFCLIAVFCSLIFVIEHIQTTMIYEDGYYKSIFDVTAREVIIITGLFMPLSLICILFMKKYGLLSAIIIHFVCDFIWRVIWAYIKMGNAMFI